MKLFNDLVTIILPAYNAENNLRCCLESLIDQTYHNFEVLIIDDGSDDNTFLIATEFQNLDSRIKVLKKDNKGPASARNLGLDKAKGTWITFCDSDDNVEDNWLQNFINNLNNVDLVSAGYKIYKSKNNISTEVFLPNKNYKSVDIQLFLYESYNIMLWGFLWCKLFKKDIIDKNNLRFSENLKFQEDLEFVLHYLTYCKLIYNSNKCTYNYNCIDSQPNKYKYYSKFQSSYLCLNHLTELMTQQDYRVCLNVYFINLIIEDIINDFLLNRYIYNELDFKLKYLRENKSEFINRKVVIGILPCLFVLTYKIPTVIFYYIWITAKTIFNIFKINEN